MRTNPLDVLRARYDEFAPTYVETWSKLEGYSALVAEFLAREVKDAASVLDVGCGPGHLTGGLPASVRVVGTDISEGMLEVARRGRPTGLYQAHDYYQPIPAALGTFDVVLALGCLDFCEDLDLVLGYLARACKPGGRLLLNVIERRAGVQGHDGPRLPITPQRMPGVDLVLYSLSESTAAFERAGLMGRRYVHCKGYLNQYHDLEVRYGLWELERPASSG